MFLFFIYFSSNKTSWFIVNMFKNYKKKHHLLRLDSRVRPTQIDGAFILNCQN